MKRRVSLLLALWSALAWGAEVNGYADSRTTFTRSRALGLIPTNDLPQVQQLFEANAQIRQSYKERGFVYGDLSLLTQTGQSYRGKSPYGNEIKIEDHEVGAVKPLVSLNEIYLSHEFRPELNLVVGKKRLVWGSGLAINPTDLINPRKDPTDPNFQRTGAYLAALEVPLGDYAFTVAASPAVIRQESGIPYQFLVHPPWDAQDTQYHYMLAARAYALVADSDINLMFFYGNRYADEFENKPRLGFSFSRYFFTDYEFHVEGLFQTGSARTFVRSSCVETPIAALSCLQDNISPTYKPLLDDPRWFPRVLVGTRTMFPDESLLSIEYLYQADGLTRGQFQELVTALDLIQQSRGLGIPANRIPSPSALFGANTVDGVPQKFSFEPQSKHYLFLTYQKPNIFDDFSVNAVVVANLQDLSTLISPSVSWSATQWLTLNLSGFIPIAGPRATSARQDSTGAYLSEYSLTPMQYRGLFQARVFY